MNFQRRALGLRVFGVAPAFVGSMDGLLGFELTRLEPRRAAPRFGRD